MKQRIFNKGKGWYISASNYKDKEDKIVISGFLIDRLFALCKMYVHESLVFLVFVIGC